MRGWIKVAIMAPNRGVGGAVEAPQKLRGAPKPRGDLVAQRSEPGTTLGEHDDLAGVARDARRLEVEDRAILCGQGNRAGFHLRRSRPAGGRRTEALSIAHAESRTIGK